MQISPQQSSSAGEFIGNIPVKRSARRRNIGIKVHPDGSCELLAPMSATHGALESALKHLTPWLQQKLQQIEQLPSEYKAHKFTFSAGSEFYFCGQPYTLGLQSGSSSSVIRVYENKLLAPSSDPAVIKAMLEAFYRRQARRLITNKVEFYCRKLDLTVNSVNINGARRRFGSCNTRGDLNFSWHLAMYPMELIEYVILHELAHRTEMNHSARFYKVLSSYLKDFRSRERELKLWTAKLSGYPE